MSNPVLSERAHDRVLTTTPKQWTAVTIGHNLLGQPHVRNDGKTLLDEIRRPVCKRAQLLESMARCPLDETLNEAGAQSKPSDLSHHDE